MLGDILRRSSRRTYDEYLLQQNRRLLQPNVRQLGPNEIDDFVYLPNEDEVVQFASAFLENKTAGEGFSWVSEIESQKMEPQFWREVRIALRLEAAQLGPRLDVVDGSLVPNERLLFKRLNTMTMNCLQEAELRSSAGDQKTAPPKSRLFDRSGDTLTVGGLREHLTKEAIAGESQCDYQNHRGESEMRPWLSRQGYVGTGEERDEYFSTCF